MVGRLLSRNIECPSDVRTDETDQALFAVVLHKAVGWLPERPGSGDGERDASMTRQLPYQPLPASVSRYRL